MDCGRDGSTSCLEPRTFSAAGWRLSLWICDGGGSPCGGEPCGVTTLGATSTCDKLDVLPLCSFDPDCAGVNGGECTGDGLGEGPLEWTGVRDGEAAYRSPGQYLNCSTSEDCTWNVP